MYKLLTEEPKKKVAREYSLRRALIVVWAVILVTIIGMAGLFPSYILSDARQREVSERLRILGELELSEEDQLLKAWLADFNLKLKVLSPRFDNKKPSLLVDKVIATKTPGIRLNSFDWTLENNVETLNVRGVAADRQSLISFEQKLEAQGLGEVALPVSNLAKDREIDFRVTLTPSKVQ
jgi:hypothetical protein